MKTTRHIAAICAVSLGIAIAGAGMATASDFTNLAAIDRHIADFTGAPIGAPGGAKQQVDRRLRLARCSQHLTLDWYGRRQDSVRVACPDSGSWQIFVPVQRASLAEPDAPLIKRGDMVSIVAQGRGFSVSRTGEAMDNGTVNDWIRVRPTGGGDPLRGRIVRPGLIVIPIA